MVSMFDDSQSRWRALQTRCEESRSAFVYAVLTTRIYCRPNCPARLARRANVVFYDTAAEAARAGFRPCKRCKPEERQPDGEEFAPMKAIKQACAIVERSPGLVTVSDLAKDVGLSPRYFHAVFKKVMGVTPGLYTRQLKAREFQSREKTSSDDKGYRKQTEAFANSCLVLDHRLVEHDDRAILMADLDLSASLPSLLLLETQAIGQHGHEHGLLPDASFGYSQLQFHDDWFDENGGDSEISASNEEWLARHNLSSFRE